MLVTRYKLLRWLCRDATNTTSTASRLRAQGWQEPESLTSFSAFVHPHSGRSLRVPSFQIAFAAFPKLARTRLPVLRPSSLVRSAPLPTLPSLPRAHPQCSASLRQSASLPWPHSACVLRLPLRSRPELSPFPWSRFAPSQGKPSPGGFRELALGPAPLLGPAAQPFCALVGKSPPEDSEHHPRTLKPTKGLTCKTP